MKKILLATLLSTVAATAFAEDTTPPARPRRPGRKLAGAAKASFAKKCVSEAVGS
jgi:hypothetical protein